jgi:site-specific DNA recombinase
MSRPKKKPFRANVIFSEDMPNYIKEIYKEYLDDGISGTIEFQKRPQGSKLLIDAQQNLFESVIFYRVDRFSRSLRILLDAYETLKQANVSIRSASEPFDTSTPLGVFVMHMLASMSELERITILERFGLGRDRHIK